MSVVKKKRLDFAPWGIDEGYVDAFGAWHSVPDPSRRAIWKAMGGDRSAPYPPPDGSVRVLEHGRISSFRGPGELLLEDGSRLPFERRLELDLPEGYHALRQPSAEKPVQLIVCPRTCFLPSDLRLCGWAIQLYSIRSKRSWGIGDFGDLREFGCWSGIRGARIHLVNPLGAATPGEQQNPSPYFPGSRVFLNVLYLNVEEVGRTLGWSREMERFRRRTKALNEATLIDHDAVYRLKMEALEFLWPRFHGASELEDYCQEQGEALKRFAVFCTLSERYRKPWSRWPREFRHPESEAIRHFGDERMDRVRFHSWIQWLLDRQLARAAEEAPLMRDLPIGFDPEGPDAWMWQDLLARDVSVGAPPDLLNTRGQDWGLPPFIPHKLRAAGYEPIRRTIGAVLRHGKGLRIDHVMGLFRLFWIPKGLAPSEGGYVRYPAKDLLAVIALESQRAGAFIVGEDLGTVEEVFRQELSRRLVLSYCLLWFEKKPPPDFPRLAMAAVTTHDLPTIAGLWSGQDLSTQKELGLNPNEKETKEIRQRLAAMIRLPESSPVEEVILRTHKLLARAPSAILTATLEDGLAVRERPNLPNTTTERPNWSIPLPLSLEKIEKDPLVLKVAEALRSGIAPRKHLLLSRHTIYRGRRHSQKPRH